MRMFEVRANEQSYRYSLTRITAGVILIALCIFRGEIFLISNKWMNVMMSGIAFVIGMGSILCILISVGECFHVHENRRRAKKNRRKEVTKILTAEEIAKIVSCADIVEIEVELEKGVAAIGASSECEKNGFVFTNKRFFIDEQEFDAIEVFIAELLHRFPEGKIHVLRIDGLEAERYIR